METQKIVNLLNAIPLNDTNSEPSKFPTKKDML